MSEQACRPDAQGDGYDLTPLHPELKARIVDEGAHGMAIKHPLLIVSGYDPSQNQEINEDFQNKVENRDLMRSIKNWESYIEVFERQFWIKEFLELAPNLDDDTYARLFARVWTECDNIYEYQDPLLVMLKVRRPSTESAMTPDELAAFDGLPEVVPIYRGYRGERKLGPSWTDKKDIAIWMARRYHGGDPRVVSATCSKGDIIAYFLRRNEYEVVVIPSDVTETWDEG